MNIICILLNLKWKDSPFSFSYFVYFRPPFILNTFFLCLAPEGLLFNVSSFHTLLLGFFLFLSLRTLRASTTVSDICKILYKYLFAWFIIDQFHPLSCHLPSIPIAFSSGRDRQIIQSKLAVKSRRKDVRKLVRHSHDWQCRTEKGKSKWLNLGTFIWKV